MKEMGGEREGTEREKLREVDERKGREKSERNGRKKSRGEKWRNVKEKR